MSSAFANVTIPTPARYMTRLAKHFEHRVPVQREERSARIRFPGGDCHLTATDTQLEIRLDAAEDAQLATYREVVARHLKQVASAETFEINWREIE